MGRRSRSSGPHPTADLPLLERPPEFARRDAGRLVERLRKAAREAEPAGESDFQDGLLGLRQQNLRFFDAALHLIAMRWHTHRGLESAAEVSRAQLRDGG